MYRSFDARPVDGELPAVVPYMLAQAHQTVSPHEYRLLVNPSGHYLAHGVWWAYEGNKAFIWEAINLAARCGATLQAISMNLLSERAKTRCRLRSILSTMIWAASCGAIILIGPTSSGMRSRVCT
jgi:hypothetical protein